jgi:hypothetical protein
MTDMKPISGEVVPMRKTKMIRISLPVTLHRPGPNYQPAEFNQAMGMMVGGNPPAFFRAAGARSG